MGRAIDDLLEAATGVLVLILVIWIAFAILGVFLIIPLFIASLIEAYILYRRRQGYRKIVEHEADYLGDKYGLNYGVDDIDIVVGGMFPDMPPSNPSNDWMSGILMADEVVPWDS